MLSDHFNIVDVLNFQAKNHRKQDRSGFRLLAIIHAPLKKLFLILILHGQHARSLPRGGPADGKPLRIVFIRVIRNFCRPARD